MGKKKRDLWKSATPQKKEDREFLWNETTPPPAATRKKLLWRTVQEDKKGKSDE